jgi:gamma-glutamyl phosphate reductase
MKMEWNPTDQIDSKVVAFTKWRNLENYGTFEERAGVYIFANVDWQVKYIGMAGAGRMVDEIRNAIGRGKDYGATRVKAIYTNSSEKAQSLEEDLIEKYNPPNNLT